MRAARRLFCVWGLCLLSVACLAGAEVVGKVEQVSGAAVTVRVPADARVAAGDHFEILVEVPEAGAAQLASGEVAAVVGDLVMGKIDRATGKVAAGQKVRFTAATPVAPAAVAALTEVRVLRGHQGPAFMVALSPDGRRALTTGIDGTLRTWDLATGKEVSRIQAHKNWAVGVAVSPHGKRAVTSGNDKTVRLWDLESGEEVRRFEGHGGWVWSVTFSSDGKRLLTGSHDKTMRLWDVETGEEVRRFECANIVSEACLSPDGRRALSAEWSGKDLAAILWDTATGEEVRALRGGRVTAAFSPDGKRALTGGGNALRLWDLETGRQLRQLEGHQNMARIVAFSPDGKRAATTGYDLTVRLWDLEAGKELARFDWQPEKGPSPVPSGVRDYMLFGVAFTPDGKRIVAAGADGLVRVLEPAPGVQAPDRPAPRVDRVDIVDRGIFKAEVIKKVDDPRWASGTWEMLGKITQVEDTTTIPKGKDTFFGFHYSVAGVPKGALVTLKKVVVYPEGGFHSRRTGKTIHREEVSLPWTVGDPPTYWGFHLGDDAPLGVWKFQVWFGDQMLAEQAFDVVAP